MVFNVLDTHFLQCMRVCYLVGMQVQMLLKHSTCAAINDACVLCQFMNINIIIKNEVVLPLVV